MNELKHVPLRHVHETLGAKMVPFAGYYMPVQYENLIKEHHAVRNAVGMFDVSHMGEFWVEGPGALDLINCVTSNDAAKLTDGKVQYSCLPNAEGGIVDDLLVYRVNAEKYMLVVNASNIEKDWAWITGQNRFECKMSNASDATSLLAVQGPKAAEALQSLTDVNLAAMEYYTFTIGSFAGVENILISATGYTGAGGFEIYCPNAVAEKLWNAIMDAGKSFGIAPCGLGARDTLRLEMGFCLYGNDINDYTSPIEAGLGWITKFTKHFVMAGYHKAIKEKGAFKKLVGFEMLDRGIPRHGYIIHAQGSDEVIGVVTSGTQAPSVGKAIGMGYVRPEFSTPGSTIEVEIRGKKLRAEVVKLPFWKG